MLYKMQIKKFMIRQKYRFDTAMTILTFVNFLFLSITASSTIKTFLFERLNLEFSVTTLVVVIFFGVITSVWFTGYILDKYVGYAREMASVSNSRNNEIMQIKKDCEDTLKNTRKLLKMTHSGEELKQFDIKIGADDLEL